MFNAPVGSDRRGLATVYALPVAGEAARRYAEISLSDGTSVRMRSCSAGGSC